MSGKLHAHKWTPEEDATFRASYAAGGMPASLAALPGLTERQLARRATTIQLRRREIRSWTPRENEELRRLWGHASMRAIAEHFHCSENAVYWQSRRIFGRGASCPQGMEYLRAAAERCGYGHNTITLRRILRWAGVRVVRSYAKPGPQTRRHDLIVDRADVDLAIEKWHRTETLQAAANRHGMSGRTMLFRLEALGVSLQAAEEAGPRTVWDEPGPRTPIHRVPIGRRKGGRLRPHIRVESAVADRAAALVTVKDAARRFLQRPATLSRWMREAGHRPPVKPRAHWWVDPAIVARVVAAHALPDGYETIEAAGRRTNVHPKTIRDWMRAAGFVRNGQYWALKIEDVDRIIAERVGEKKGAKAA